MNRDQALAKIKKCLALGNSGNLLLQRGHVVNGDLTKPYRRKS